MTAANGRPGRTLLVAAAACALAALLFAVTLIRAVGLDQTVPVGGPEHDAAGAVSADTDVRDTPLSAEALLLAVEHNPFAPDRQRPPARYRLPGDVDPEPPPPPPPAPPLPPFVLYGTVVDTDQSGSAALIQLGDEPARLIPVGASLAGYQLAHVAQQSAVMSNGEREIMLQVPGPQRQVAAAPVDTRQRGNTRMTPGDRQGAAAADLRQRVEAAREQQMRQFQMVEALERARQSGAPPDMIEALERAIQQSGNAPMIFRRNTVPDTTQSPTPRAPDLR